MKGKILSTSSGLREFALVFDPGDEVLAGLKDFAQREQLGAAAFTAIGALSDVTLGYFELDKQDYHKVPLRGQVEVLSLIGDVSLKPNGDPEIHAHLVVGKRDGTAYGGHLLSAHVRPTLEVMLTESPAHLRRSYRPEFGLALIDLEKEKS